MTDGDLAEASCREVLECLHDLLVGVHDERPVMHDRLADRLATQDEDVKGGGR